MSESLPPRWTEDEFLLLANRVHGVVEGALGECPEDNGGGLCAAIAEDLLTSTEVRAVIARPA